MLQYRNNAVVAQRVLMTLDERHHTLMACHLCDEADATISPHPREL
jgi:hypothetical protein